MILYCQKSCRTRPLRVGLRWNNHPPRPRPQTFRPAKSSPSPVATLHTLSLSPLHLFLLRFTSRHDPAGNFIAQLHAKHLVGDNPVGARLVVRLEIISTIRLGDLEVGCLVDTDEPSS